MNTFTGCRGVVGVGVGVPCRGVSSFSTSLPKFEVRGCPLGIARRASSLLKEMKNFYVIFLFNFFYIFFSYFSRFFFHLLLFVVEAASGWNWLWMNAVAEVVRRVASRRIASQLTLFLIPSCPLSRRANEACKSPNQDVKRKRKWEQEMV